MTDKTKLYTIPVYLTEELRERFAPNSRGTEIRKALENYARMLDGAFPAGFSHDELVLMSRKDASGIALIDKLRDLSASQASALEERLRRAGSAGLR